MTQTLLTAKQMRDLERTAMDSGLATGLELMETAGRAVIDATFAHWPELQDVGRYAAILCGPGNNGGDGFVMARLLKQRGWKVEVFLYGDPEKLPPDARTNYERWIKLGAVEPFPLPEDHPRWDGEHRHDLGLDLLVDAIFGTGLTRPIAPDLSDVFSEINRYDESYGSPVTVSVDVPSGLQSDTGAVLGNAIAPDLTVTFHSAKLGHYLANGARLCKNLRVVPIGIDPSALASVLTAPEGLDPEDLRSQPPEARVAKSRFADGVPLAEMVPSNYEKHSGHKYDYGHVLVLTGGMGRTGAARLAARGALRIGAGLVTLAAPGAAMMECAAQITALMLSRCDDAEALEAMLEDTRLNVLCLGPGLGTDARGAALVEAAIASGRGCVLDADALTLLADTKPFPLHDKCVLTPHGGEFARLFPDIAERLQSDAAATSYSKVDATRDAAAQAGCTVLFKGVDTVIASRDGSAMIHAASHGRAAPWLATAGSGDVLAGIIAGLMARRYSAHDAASAAARLHTEAARAFGPGLIAEDLPEMIPRVLATPDPEK